MTKTVSKAQLASLRVVCIGGGTGVPSSIKALKLLGIAPDAVVSVADDGGSSGLLRSHTGQAPPGDLRKCLVALAGDPQNPWVKAFRARFEYANDHALGNLILTALQQTTGSLTESIALCEELLQTSGHVYPASLEGVLLTGTTRDGQKLVGQSTICKSETALDRVSLEPASAPANPAAVAAIRAADVLVFGPGSLFTSIIPNVLIPGIAKAIRSSKAATVFVCPLIDVQGETWGLDAAELTEALLVHGLEGRLDYVLVNKEPAPKPSGNVTGYFSAIGVETSASLQRDPEVTPRQRPVAVDENVVQDIRIHGVKVLLREMRDAVYSSRHDPQMLAKALASVIADSKRL